MVSCPSPLQRGAVLWSLVCLGVLVLPGPRDSGARVPTEPIQFNVENQLPDSHILSIDQGPDGRLWLLDRVAVRVFDGTDLVTYNSAHGLSLTRVGDLAVDKAGRPWVASGWGDPQVFRFLDGTWQALPRIPPGTFYDTSLYLAILEHEDRQLVAMGTGKDGLWLWNVGQGPTGEPFRPSPRLPSTSVTALTRIGDRIAVGTDRGLCFLGADAALDCDGPAAAHPRLGGPIHALKAVTGSMTTAQTDNDRRLWIWGGSAEKPAPARGEAVGSWIGFLEEHRLTVHADENKLPKVILDPKTVAVSHNLLQPDGGGGIYFGNAGELHHLNPDGHSLLLAGRGNPWSPHGASALFRDHEGQVWIGTVEGARRMPGLRFSTLGRRSGLLEDEVTAVLELDSGDLLLGHNIGLTLLRDGRPIPIPFDGENDERNAFRIFDMEQSAEGTVWLATYTAGLQRFDPETFRLSRSGQIDVARSLTRDRDGRLWLAGEKEVFEIVGERLVPHPVSTGADYLRWIEATGDGRLLLSSQDGLVILGPAGATHARAQEGLSNNLFSVRELQNGEIWVGTTSGVLQLEQDRLVPVKGGFPSLRHPVFFIFEALDGRVWLGTEDGVFIWNGSSLRHLTVRHGLAGRETNRGAGFVGRDGDIWIGTDRGLSRFHPSYDRRPVRPNVQVTDVEVAGRRLPLDRNLRLEPDENSLTFHYRVVTFEDEEPLMASYALDGFDPEPQGPFPVTAQQIRYTNLPHGTYRLRLSAGWPDGAWSEEIVSHAVTIRRPAWRHPAVLTLAAMALPATIFGLYLLRTRNVRRRSLELEAMNRALQEAAEEREHLIESLEAKNVELERFTYTVSHDLKSPLVTIRGFLGFVRQAHAQGRLDDIEQDLEQIDAAADKMGRLLDELLELARIGRVVNPPERFCLAELTHEVLGLTAAKIEECGARVTLVEPMPEIYGDRLRLRMVLQNLIENALKFARPDVRPEIVVDGHVLGDEDAGHAVFRVTDNGIGIPEDQQDRIFGLFKRLNASIPGTGIGLALVRRIVEAHQGEIWVEPSDTDHGSRFIVRLPDLTPHPTDP